MDPYRAGLVGRLLLTLEQGVAPPSVNLPLVLMVHLAGADAGQAEPLSVSVGNLCQFRKLQFYLCGSEDRPHIALVDEVGEWCPYVILHTGERRSEVATKPLIEATLSCL